MSSVPCGLNLLSVRFTAFEQTGNTQHLYQLPDLLQAMMCKHGLEAQPTVEISYEDDEGHWFRRSFTSVYRPL
jgi:hypothetical protein